MIYVYTLFGLAVLWWLLLEYYGQRPPTTSELIQSMSSSLETTAEVIGDRLIPSVDALTHGLSVFVISMSGSADFDVVAEEIK